MMSKIDVNGGNAHPLYRWLTAEAPGLLGSKAIKWNFTKFLVGRDGKVVQRYAPTDTPQSLARDIEAVLNAWRSARVCARVVHVPMQGGILARWTTPSTTNLSLKTPGSWPWGREWGVGLEHCYRRPDTFRTLGGNAGFSCRRVDARIPGLCRAFAPARPRTG